MIYSPLDIPPIPNKQHIIDQFTGDESIAWWREETLLGEKTPGVPFDGPRAWTEKSKKYPQLVEWIKQYFPFEYFVYVRIARSKSDVWPHVDANYTVAPRPHHMTMAQWLIDDIKINEPCGYRFIVSGSRTNLYMCKNYDPDYKDESVLDQPKTYCTIPNETDSFVINHQEQPHGVDVDEKFDHNRIIGFVMGKVDVARHRQLLEKSFSKYQQFTVENV